MVCDRIESTEEMHVQITGNEAVMEVTTDDDQGLDSHFITGPDFGCTLHSERK